MNFSSYQDAIQQAIAMRQMQPQGQQKQPGTDLSSLSGMISPEMLNTLIAALSKSSSGPMGPTSSGPTPLSGGMA